MPIGKANRGRAKANEPKAAPIDETYVIADPPEDKFEFSSPQAVISKNLNKDEFAVSFNYPSESEENESEEEKYDEENDDEEKKEEEKQEDNSSGGEVSDSDEVLSPPKPAPRKRGVQGKDDKSSVSIKTQRRKSLVKVMKAKGNTKTKLNKMAKERIEPDSKRGKMMNIVLKGLSTLDDRKGVSMPALRKYVMEDKQNEGRSWEKMRSGVRKALEEGLENNLITRPKGSENKNGLIGNFKINKKLCSDVKSKPTTSKSVEGHSAKTTSKSPKKTQKSSENLKNKDKKSGAVSKTTDKKLAKEKEELERKKNEKLARKKEEVARKEQEELERKMVKTKKVVKSKLKRSISSTNLSSKQMGALKPKAKLMKSKSLEQLTPVKPTIKKTKLKK